LDGLDERTIFDVGVALAISVAGLAALAWFRREKKARARETEAGRSARLKSWPRMLPKLSDHDFEPLKGRKLVAVIVLLVVGLIHEIYGKR
jgi:hypothetical protein